MSVYLYGISRPPGPGPLEISGVEQASVRAVDGNGVIGIVSDVRTVPVPASRANLMAHAKVLESIHSRCGVLPMRFGTLFPDDEGLSAELLERRRVELDELLDHLQDRVELTVKAFYDQESVLREIVAEEASIRALRDELRRPGADEAYLRSVRLGELVAAALERKRQSDAGRLIEPLRRLAVDVRVGDTPVEGIVVNAAFLVDRDRLADFDATVGSLEDDLGKRAALKYVGPLPPYSFVDVELGDPGAALSARRS